MSIERNHSFFKKSIILFWTIWWLIALWTDVVGGLAHLNILDTSWAVDTNYPGLVQSLAMYHVPEWLPPCLFFGIILWSALSSALYIWASISLFKENTPIWKERAQWAFIVSLNYWFAFFLADQMVMKFALEENHMVQGGFQLLTYMAIYLLPDEATKV